MTTTPTTRSVRELFSGDARYVVPMYQREYAWTSDEILTLLQDVQDSRARNPEVPYYIGSLVTYPRRGSDATEVVHEVVDGQQRLTTLYMTLSLLAAAGRGGLKRVDGRLDYEARDQSSDDLDVLARRATGGRGASLDRLGDAGIRQGATTIQHALDGDMLTAADIDYLLDQVMIVHTELPPGTDLNHYFEIMNSRGEQLEKHEIVKAHLMSFLRHFEREPFARVWDACSDMTKFVQAKFDTGTRSDLFGPSWDTFRPTDTDALFGAGGASDAPSKEPPSTSIVGLIGGSSGAHDVGTRDAEDDDTSRYGSVVDFPNFLLHALKLHRGDEFTWDTETDGVSLDDKRLIESFRSIKDRDDARGFLFTLLRARYLFDGYVIKTDQLRDTSDDDANWVLRKPAATQTDKKRRLRPLTTFGRRDEEEVEGHPTSDHQRRIVLLQSMFQVTDSRRAYKNFLYGILRGIWGAGDAVEGQQMIDLLEDLLGSRLDRILSGKTGLDDGVRVPHFVFNALDYRLWRDATANPGAHPATLDVAGFRFRYRKSVEHFYPQHPDAPHEDLGQSLVDEFGNLCLMTRSENSQRSNLVPEAKIKQYVSKAQSLKFQLMAWTAETEGWGPHQIRKHGNEMRELLGAPPVEAAPERVEERVHAPANNSAISSSGSSNASS